MKEFRFAFRRGSASAFRIFTAAACARRLILSWLIAVAVQYLSLPRPLRSLTELDGLAAQSFFLLCFMTLTAFILFSLLAKKFLTQRIERWGIFFVFALLSLAALCSSFTVPYFVGCLLILAMLGVYAGFGWNGRKENGEEPIRPLQNFRPYIILTGFALLFFVFVSVWTVCRVLSYSCPTFDFGIFSQMFHQMKTSGLPTTTVERDGLLSHFFRTCFANFLFASSLLQPVSQAGDPSGSPGCSFGIRSDPALEALPPARAFSGCLCAAFSFAPSLPGLLRRRQL